MTGDTLSYLAMEDISRLFKDPWLQTDRSQSFFFFFANNLYILTTYRFLGLSKPTCFTSHILRDNLVINKYKLGTNK